MEAVRKKQGSGKLLKTRRSKALAALMAAAITVTGFSVAPMRAMSADSGEPSASVIEKTADAPSDYGAHMSEPDDTSQVGRVKTDKTVRTVAFDAIDRNSGDPVNPQDIGDNFAVTFSALSSGGTIAGESTVPIDLVFILDLSKSMSINGVDGEGDLSRLGVMINSLNTAIKELMVLNPDNRVAVVGYGDYADTIIPLQSLSPTMTEYVTTDYMDVISQSIDAVVTPNPAIQGGRAMAVDGRTNTQMGIYTGMNILANADTQVQIGGTTVNRIPGVILMADGGSNVNHNNPNWWNLSTSDQTYTGTTGATTYSVGYYYLTTLEAAFMKNKVKAHYSADDCLIYTVGLGLGANITDTASAVAHVVMNPSEYVEDDGTIINTGAYFQPAAREAFKTAWTNLQNGMTAIVYSGGRNNRITVNVPTGENAQYIPTSLKYNDGFTSTANAEELINAFSSAIQTITERAYTPTATEDITGETSGYVTFTDTVGDLMEVKGFDSILWVDHMRTLPDGSPNPNYGVETEYTNVSKTTSGKVDTYVFDDPVHSSWLFDFEDTNLNTIIITVDRSGANDVVTIKVPPALVPMVDYNVKKSGGTVTEVTRNEETRPVKINYVVGPKEGVVDYIAGKGDIADAELKAQVDAYIANSANKVTTANGSGIAIYTNHWRGPNEGIPYAEFAINPLNNYYSFAKRTPLYTDSACTVPATSFTEGTTYYYKSDVYVVGATGW